VEGETVEVREMLRISARELFFPGLPSLTTSAKTTPRLNFWLASISLNFALSCESNGLCASIRILITMAGLNALNSFKWLSRNSRGLLSGAEATTVLLSRPALKENGDLTIR
jgi:hypothetical protein